MKLLLIIFLLFFGFQTAFAVKLNGVSYDSVSYPLQKTYLTASLESAFTAKSFFNVNDFSQWLDMMNYESGLCKGFKLKKPKNILREYNLLLISGKCTNG